LFIVQLAGQGFDGNAVELAEMAPENETLIELSGLV